MTPRNNLKKGILAAGLAGLVASMYSCITASNQIDEISSHRSGAIGEYFKIKHTPYILDEIAIKSCHQLYATAKDERKEWLHYGLPVQPEFEKPILAQCRELSIFREQIVSRIKELEANPLVIAAINKRDNLFLEAFGYTATGFLSVLLLFGTARYYFFRDTKNPTQPL